MFHIRRMDLESKGDCLLIGAVLGAELRGANIDAVLWGIFREDENGDGCILGLMSGTTPALFVSGIKEGITIHLGEGGNGD